MPRHKNGTQEHSMPKLPWIERNFSFPDDTRTHPDVIERFRGTPARIEDRLRNVPREVLTRTDGGWTILQNIGHLLDLESLWDGRLDDFLAGKPDLRPADMTNLKTREAGHNQRELSDLLGAFRRERLRQAARLESLSEADFSRISIHPRLKTPMRLVDAVAFVCAHDDYHLARIAELTRKFA